MQLKQPSLEAFIRREGLPAVFRSLIDRLHTPMAERIAAEARRHSGTMVVGLCGAQGSGKTTMAQVLRILLAQRGVAAAVLSIDDLYLTRDERIELSRRVHPLLRTRGVPGTHDTALGMQTLTALSRSGFVSIPAFDKASDDRLPRERWPRIEAPVQTVIFEGWCVGAVSQPEAALASPVNALERDLDGDGVWRRFVNDALADAYQALFARVDLLVLLQAPSFEVVYRWRLEQERKLRDRIAGAASAARTMSDEETERFIAHFERLTRHILAEMPSRADIVVELDEMRSARDLPAIARRLRQLQRRRVK